MNYAGSSGAEEIAQPARGNVNLVKQEPSITAEACHAAFRALLDSGPYDDVDERLLGKHADTYTSLREVRLKYGLEATRTAFAALAANDPTLAVIVASDDDPTSQSRFTVHWAREALEPQPDKDWIIDDILAVGDVGIGVGEGGSKKTYCFLAAGICVALGRPWLRFQARQGTVLVVDEESGLDRLNRRLGQLMRGHNAGSDTPLAYISLESVDLLTQAGADELERLVEQLGARFVLIDALVDVMLGADENTAQDVQPVFHRLRKIAFNQRCAILVIHHANKMGGYRGSSAIKGAVDLMLFVESKPEEPLIRFKTEKSRDSLPVKFTAYISFQEEIVVIGTADDDVEGRVESRRFGKAASYVLRYLRDHGASLLADIEGHADVCTPRTARDAVYALTADGYSERVDAGGQGSAATYGLTAKGVEAAKGV